MSITSFVHVVELLSKRLLPSWLPSTVTTKFPFLLEAGCFEVNDFFPNLASVSLAALIASMT